MKAKVSPTYKFNYYSDGKSVLTGQKQVKQVVINLLLGNYIVT